MEKCDLVIGAITGYKFPQIAPWVNSLDRSGFQGTKALVCYNVEYETIHELSKRGYTIFAFGKDDTRRTVYYPKDDFSIVVDRFIHYYFFLDTPQYQESFRYVIATDVKDVIFQKNPSAWLNAYERANLDDLILSSEGLEYEHEPWGANNMRQAFGKVFYEKHKTNVICNAGVIAGRYEAFMGLCKSIYLICLGAPQHVPGGGGPDQAALNLLMDTTAYRTISCVADHSTEWAAQLGTMMDPTKFDMFAPFFVDPKPYFNKESGLVQNPYGNPYTIVHQWDRVPEVRAAVERMYA